MAKRSILFLVLAVVLLLVIGFVMLASASYLTLDGTKGDYSMVWKQAFWLLIALLAGGWCMATDYGRLMKWRWHLLVIAVLSLILCYIPGVGVEVNGAWRWIGLEFLGYRDFRVQPSEFAKVALVISIAAWYAKHEPHARTFSMGFVLPVGMMMVVALLIGGEMDLGSAFICIALSIGMMVVAGARKRYMAMVGAVGVVALSLMVWITPNRMHRVQGFASELPVISQYVKLDSLPESDRKEIKAKKRHQENSIYAFGSGGVEGVGPGQGRMKLYSLPEAHTDFIFALVGEELGLQGTLAAVLAFVVIVLSGMCIAAYAPDRFGKLLGFGLTFLFGLEGLVNMGVTTAVLPNKGLPLPFVSAGGTSLLMAMISVGILCNIYRQGVHLSASELPILRRRNRWTPQV